ncbi:DUF6241 domain-containing protein [Evansella sp. AB-rgal1]|uniref:DUF6241 domain-containing protein n=1 Tax=Evansella sp. AB-rgal1 TaxID=3242696 RepID=UPI00359CE593
MNKIQWISVVVLVVVIVGYGMFSFFQQEETQGDADELEENPIPDDSDEREQESDSEEEEVIMGGIPTAEEVEEEFPLDLPAQAVENNIHWMSHQKVYADEKWGKMRITEERIDRLIEVVEANSFRHEGLYLSILKRWQNGDFSRAVEDHNDIWKLQGGTIGKATRLLTEEEERIYIETHYRE